MNGHPHTQNASLKHSLEGIKPGLCSLYILRGLQTSLKGSALEESMLKQVLEFELTKVKRQAVKGHSAGGGG